MMLQRCSKRHHPGHRARAAPTTDCARHDPDEARRCRVLDSSALAQGLAMFGRRLAALCMGPVSQVSVAPFTIPYVPPSATRKWRAPAAKRSNL